MDAGCSKRYFEGFKIMLYFPSLLKTPQYSLSAENLFSAIYDCGEVFALFDGTKDI